MTEPTPAPSNDPSAVILARMEVKLDNALAEQSRHSTIIERHDRTLGEHANDITALRTTLASVPREISELQARKYVAPSSLAWAFGTAVMALGVLVAFLGYFLAHGGG